MRICHFSDLHWEFAQLPAADIYVCTGDLYDNYPKRRERRGGPGRWYDRDGPDRWYIDPANERKKQLEATKLLVTNGGFAKYMGNPAAPIVCVRGNHDFIDLAPLFEGLNVTELFCNEIYEILGLKFTGHRGVPPINGAWNDELSVEQLEGRVSEMPPADVFLTHYPPRDILDGSWSGYPRWGLHGMSAALQTKARYEEETGFCALHCFGHIHEQGGKVVDHNGFLFSNAATGYNEIEYDGKSFKDVTRL